jgi:hypothetical protein
MAGLIDQVRKGFQEGENVLFVHTVARRRYMRISTLLG